MLEVLFLAICLSSREVPGMRFSENLLCRVQITESCLRTMQLQLCVGQPKVSFWIVRLQLQSDLKILRRFCAFMKVIQDEAAAFISGRHLGIALQGPGKVGQRLMRLTVMNVNITLNQGKVFVVGEN